MTTWFTASQLGPDQLNSPAWTDRPEATMLHAKKIGTSFTACGRDTLNWYKHWEPFDPRRAANACRRCVDTLIAASM